MKRNLLEEVGELLRQRGFDEELIANIQEKLKKYYRVEKGDFVFPSSREIIKELLPLFTSSLTVEKIISSLRFLGGEKLEEIWITEGEMKNLLEEVGKFFRKLISRKNGEKTISDFFFSTGLKQEKREFSEILRKHFQGIFTPGRIQKTREKIMRFVNSLAEKEKKEAEYLLQSFILFPEEDNLVLKFIFIKSLVRNMGLEEEIKNRAKDEQEKKVFLDYLERKIYNLMNGGEK